MKVLRNLAAVVLASAAASVAPAAADAAGVGNSPPRCTGNGDPPVCVIDGGGGDVTATPKLIQKGEAVTITLTSDGAYGGIASYGSGPTIGPAGKGRAPRLKFLGCTGGKIVTDADPPPYNAATRMTTPRKCRYKALSSGSGWQIADWSYIDRYGGLSAHSQDAFRVVGSDKGYVQGFVRGLPRSAGDKNGPGAIGVQVVASNRKHRASDKTDSNGFYAIEIKKPGRYDVTPKRRASDRDLRPVPEFKPLERRVHVDDTVEDVNFRLGRGDSYMVKFRAGGGVVQQVFANGSTLVEVEVLAEDLNERPVPNLDLALQVNHDTLNPKGVMRAPNGPRLWPGVAESGIRRATVDTPVRTGGDGKALLNLFPGTEPGEFTLTVRSKFGLASEQPRSATLTFTTSAGGDLPGQMRAALGNVPNSPRPSNNAAQDPRSAHSENIEWLGAAFTANQLGGWTFLPVRVENVEKYGLIFYPLGSPPAVDPSGTVSSGAVFNEGGGRGLQPVADGEAFEDLASWSGGKRVVLAYLFNGPYSDLEYLGYPLESGVAEGCIRNG